MITNFFSSSFFKKSPLPFSYQGGVFLTTVDPDLKKKEKILNRHQESSI